MASRAPLFFLVICICFSSGSSFINVVCDKTITVPVAQKSLLTCKVETTQEIPDLTISVVAWKKKNGDDYPVLSALDKREGKKGTLEPGYEVVLKDRTMSLVITNPEVKDEGVYMCHVVTDSGNDEATTNLKVTAKYDTPIVDIIDEKVVPNARKSLICKATGGYPEGKLRWFDENGTEWTKSAEPTVKKMENGLLELYSKLPLMEKSTFNKYTCVVYNASGGKEGSASHTIDGVNNDASIQDPTKTSLSAIIAPVLVIGSLIVGLLLALLICRKRFQQKNRRPSTAPLMGTHDTVPNSDEELDPPPPYCEESKDSMA